MRAKDFITEWNPLDQYYKEIDPETNLPIGPARPEPLDTNEADKILSMISQNCGQYTARAIKSNTFIKRGMASESRPYFILDPSKTIRKSANTNNVYTLFTSVSPKWRKFPKRQQSVICSTGEYASDYGNLYAIFPYDNAPVGIAPTMDFWNAFDEGMAEVGYHGGDLGDFSKDILRAVFIVHGEEATDQSDQALRGTNAQAVINILKGITHEKAGEIINSKKYSSYEVAILQSCYMNDLNLLEVIDAVMDPATNGIIAANGANCIGKLQRESQEVWIGGPCIAISLSPRVQAAHPEVTEILKALKLGRYARATGI